MLSVTTEFLSSILTAPADVKVPSPGAHVLDAIVREYHETSTNVGQVDAVKAYSACSLTMGYMVAEALKDAEMVTEAQWAHVVSMVAALMAVYDHIHGVVGH